MTNFKLSSRDYKKKDTVIQVGDIKIGSNDFIIMAGPCAVESEEQLIKTAKALKKSGIHILRGGAFKPRTSPYSFQGLGEEALKLLKKAMQNTSLPVVTEDMDTRDVELVAQYAEIIQG